MKAYKLTYLLVVALAMTMATGCKKKSTPLTPLPNYAMSGPRTPGPTDMTRGQPLVPDDSGSFAQNPDLSGDLEGKFTFDPTTLASHTVHFDFDSSVVKSSEKGNVEAVAAYLKSNKRVSLLIAGHCDERGTEEYNRALGEHRALALRDALIADGVEGSRMVTRSYGEDQPVDPAHNEAAWAKNRRGVFIVLIPK